MKKYHNKNISAEKIIKTLTHEIRNPLFNIKSFLETLYEYHFQLTDIQILEFLEIANQETNRLVRMTNHSLHNFKFSTSFPVILKLFSIENLVTQVTKSYEPTVLNKKIILYNKINRPLPRVIGNYDLVFQVLTNLLTNSIKFTYPKGLLLIKIKKITSISLRERRKKYTIRIDILDTGIGFMIKQAEMRSSRSKEVNKSKHFPDGLGIGLSIAKDIMFIHKKSIVLNSGINRGTNIFLNL